MNPAIIFTDYLLWHYTVAFRDMAVVWGNLFWFVLHFFSIPTLLRTLFSPWKRIKEEYHKQGMEDFLATVVVNTMTRIVGAVIRSVLIIIGLIALALLAILAVAFVVVWVLAPLVAIVSLLAGISLLF